MYSNVGKNAQDTYLSRFIAPYPVKRKRERQNSTTPRPNEFSVTYYLLRDSKHVVRVCKKFFLKALGLGKHRVNLLSKTLFEGKIPRDGRGGDRKSGNSVTKKESVHKFIASLPAKESHYNRQKSKRIYLSYELNIRTLWKGYNNSVSDENLKVNETMFRRVFEKDFNIGFSSPASDICSTCLLYKNKLKIEKDPNQIAALKGEYAFHKIRAKAFTSHMKRKPENSLSLCFDLQQVQPLPKTPIQESFYLRQISFYSLCITDIDTQHPYFYVWTENMAKRGSTEISSALLSHLDYLDLNEIEVLRLFADGCGGQNKNSHVIHTLIFWLKNHAPSNLDKIIVTFPVRGHSYLPADRVFGRVEKDLRKKPLLLRPQEYHEIYAKHGKVKVLSEDWNLFDIKGLETHYKKLECIRDAKRVIIKKRIENQVDSEVTQTRSRGRGRGSRRGRGRGACNTTPSLTHFMCGVKSLNNYNNDEDTVPYTNILKQGVNHPSLLRRMPSVNEIKPQKKKDVERILVTQFGDDWAEHPEIEWYKEIIQTASRSTDTIEIDEEGERDDVDNCECLEVDLTEVVI